MGGRGSSSGLSVSREDSLQLEAVKNRAVRYRLENYEYTDRNGKLIKGKTQFKKGGITRGEFDKRTAELAKIGKSELQKKLKDLENAHTEAFQRFTWAAASRSGSQLSAMSSAGSDIRRIKEILQRR